MVIWYDSADNETHPIVVKGTLGIDCQGRPVSCVARPLLLPAPIVFLTEDEVLEELCGIAFVHSCVVNRY